MSLLAAALGVMMYMLGTGGGVGGGNPGVDVERLRDQAIKACDAHRWDECKEKLDQAQSQDPTGERRPRVIAARKALREAGKP